MTKNDQETFGIPRANILLKNISRSAGPIAQATSYARVIHIGYRIQLQSEYWAKIQHMVHSIMKTPWIFPHWNILYSCRKLARTFVTRICKLLYFKWPHVPWFLLQSWAVESNCKYTNHCHHHCIKLSKAGVVVHRSPQDQILRAQFGLCAGHTCRTWPMAGKSGKHLEAHSGIQRVFRKVSNDSSMSFYW